MTGDPLRSEEKKGPPWIPNGHSVRFLLLGGKLRNFDLWWLHMISMKRLSFPIWVWIVKTSAEAAVSKQGWTGRETATWRKDLFRFLWIKHFFQILLRQVEKISKLILGEIRQIRQIIETENCQVSPATELPPTVETNSNGGIFTLASSNGVASSAVVRKGDFERRPEKSRDLEEKLRSEPELLFCCCSWPRTRLLWWLTAWFCYYHVVRASSPCWLYCWSKIFLFIIVSPKDHFVLLCCRQQPWLPLDRSRQKTITTQNCLSLYQFHSKWCIQLISKQISIRKQILHQYSLCWSKVVQFPLPSSFVQTAIMTRCLIQQFSRQKFLTLIDQCPAKVPVSFIHFFMLFTKWKQMDAAPGLWREFCWITSKI